MNFLLHRHLAHEALGGLIEGAGAMLPDLWRMADRRVRTAPADVARDLLGEGDAIARALIHGIEHHLEADLWFHEAAVFVEGERATIAALRGAQVAAKKLTLFAHPLWEMILDGALVRRFGERVVRTATAEGFRLAVDAFRAAAHVHHFAHAEDGEAYKDEFERNLLGLTNALSTGPWIGAYASPEGLVRALAGMRRRFGLPPFTEEERDRLAAAIATLEPRADAAVTEILTRPA